MRPLKYGLAPSENILISKYKGQLYATGNQCSHSGVPLDDGVLIDDKILSPAYGAAFSIQNGTPEQAPALNGIPTFKVTERDNKFYVHIPKEGF
jgi:nitrite reductase/ring-hydroxylating ferredoxin subunit